MKSLMDKFRRRKESSHNWARDSVLSSARFEGFVGDIHVRRGLTSGTGHSFDCGVLRPRFIRKLNIGEEPTYANVQFLKFLPGGKRLLCVEVKATVITQALTWQRSLPLSQIVIMRCGIGGGRSLEGVDSDDFKSMSQNIFQESSLPLEFLTIFCVDMSSNGNYLAICGINKNNKKHIIIVYRITLKFNSIDTIESSGYIEGERIEITEVALYKLEGSGVLAAKVTACKFSPDSSILVTTVCNDFFLNSRQNHIDFWNFRSGSHVGRLDPVMNYRTCNKTPRGYISSLTFSPDGDTIVVCTSALQVLLYSMSRSAFGSDIYSIKLPAEFREDKWQPVYCCWMLSLGISDFVVCSQDGTIASYRLNSNDLTLSIIRQSQIFNNAQLAGLYVCGAEFCSATSKLLIRVSCSETFVYDVVSDVICQRLVCGTLSLGETQRMLSVAMDASTAISRDGREVAMSAGETINIFLLPEHNLSLLSLCRNMIIRHIPESKIIDLPIPKHLQVFLLFCRCVLV